MARKSELEVKVGDFTTKRPWLILGCAWLLGFSMFAGILCIPPMGHIIKEELIISHAQIGLIFSIPLIVLAAVAIPSGFLTDRIGIRRAAGIGAIVITGASFLKGAFSLNFEMLLALTVLYGVGLGLAFPNLPKLVGAWFPREKAGLVTGIYATGIAIGCGLPLAITLPIIFPISNTFQGVFYIWGIPAAVATVLWWIIVREPSPIDENDQGQQVSWKKKEGLSQPVWKNRNIWLVALLFFCNNVHMYTWSGWAPTLLRIKGAPEDLAALIVSVMLWASIPAVFLIPWASYKVGLRKPFIWASAIAIAFASLSAIFIPVSASWFLMVVVGIVLGSTFAMILALPVEMVESEFVGRASGMILSIGYIGGFIGPWLAGYILDVTETLILAMVVLAGVGIAWACATFVISETGSKAKP